MKEKRLLTLHRVYEKPEVFTQSLERIPTKLELPEVTVNSIHEKKHSPINVINKKTGEELVIQNLYRFCCENNLDTSTAVKCLKDKVKSKTHKGWYFKYV